MKLFAVVGWTWNGECYCDVCAERHPRWEQMKDSTYDGGPIFVDSESDHPLNCADCERRIQNTVLDGAYLYAGV